MKRHWTPFLNKFTQLIRGAELVPLRHCKICVGLKFAALIAALCYLCPNLWRFFTFPAKFALKKVGISMKTSAGLSTAVIITL